MAKFKYTIELDDKIIETLKKQFQSIVEKLNPSIAPKSFENFLEQIIDSYVKTGEQIKDLGSNLGSKLGNIFDKFGGLGDIDLENLFNQFSGNKDNKDEEKKSEKPKETNLKN
jgi:hypothetical protein